MTSNQDHQCHLLPARSLQHGYFGFPHNITFTVQYPGYKRSAECQTQAEYHFYRKGVDVSNKTNSIVSNCISCSNLTTDCCQYNITLMIKHITHDDIGDYDFKYYGVRCMCQSEKNSHIHLQAQGNQFIE